MKEYIYKSADTGEIVSEEFAKANPKTTYKLMLVDADTAKLEFNTYQEIIKKTAIFPPEIGLSYCAMGLSGEAGEVAEKIKKLYRDENYNSLNALGKLQVLEDNKDAIAKELGDVLWYITAMANEIGYDLEQIAQMNYDKLLKRRSTNTLKGSGDNREEQ